MTSKNISKNINYPNYDGTQNCAKVGVDMFFQDYHGKNAVSEMADLREFCSTCPLLVECAEYAIRHEQHGFWGGTTPNERRNIRKSRGIMLDLPETRIKNNGD